MYSTALQHHGIKGQKWGVRRFQNEDGTLTPAGKSRYMDADGRVTREGLQEIIRIKKAVKRNWNNAINSALKEFEPLRENILDKYDRYPETHRDDNLDVWYYTERGQQYLSELSDIWTTVYSKKLSEVVNTDFTEMGQHFIQSAPFMDCYKRRLRPR